MASRSPAVSDSGAEGWRQIRVRGEASWAWPAFRRLGASQAAHAVGDAMVAVALANTLFFAVPVGEARSKVALYLGVTMAPFSVLAPIVGPLLDKRRGRYRLATLVGHAGRALFAVWLSSRTDRLALYPLAFGLLVLSRVHGVSRSALVPECTPPARSLMWANAWLSVVSIAGGGVGAGIALGLNHFWGPGAALWAAATVFAAGTVVSVGLPPPKDADKSAVHEVVKGDLKALLSSRLLAGGVCMATTRAAVGYLSFLLAFLLRGQGQTGKGFGMALAAAAAGALVGSAVAPVLRSKLHEPVLLLGSLGFMAAAAYWAALDFSVGRAAVVAGAVAIGTSVGRIAFDGLLQRDAPQAIFGRTFTRYETIFQLCWVGGAALATVIHWGPELGLRVLAAISVGGIALSLHGLTQRAKLAQVTDGDQGQPYDLA